MLGRFAEQKSFIGFGGKRRPLPPCRRGPEDQEDRPGLVWASAGRRAAWWRRDAPFWAISHGIRHDV